MKKSFFFLVLPLLVCACSADGGKRTVHTAYLDEGVLTTDVVRLSWDPYLQDRTIAFDDCHLTIDINVKNLTTETAKEFEFTDYEVVRESTNAVYAVTSSKNKVTLDGEISGQVSFSTTIPTSLEEHYYFTVKVLDFSFRLNLYEKPDELCEDLYVEYYVDKRIAYTEKAKKGKPFAPSYVYESPDHLSYCDKWKDKSGNQASSSRLDHDIELYGVTSPTLKTLTTSSDQYLYVYGLNHLHSDGVVVVPEKYNGKELCLYTYALHDNKNIKEVYLPRSLHQIAVGNFEKCPSLTTIYYAGSESEWQEIPNASYMPSNVKMVYNRSFTY